MMGSCTSSAKVAPASRDQRNKPSDVTITLNERNKDTSTHILQNGHAHVHHPQKKQKEVRIQENGEYCDKNEEKQEKDQTNHKSLRADLSMKEDARKSRERKLLERQKTRVRIAQEMSHRVMEEKEMLSLTSRSRTTSRATSRININQGASTSHNGYTGMPADHSQDDLTDAEDLHSHIKQFQSRQL